MFKNPLSLFNFNKNNDKNNTNDKNFMEDGTNILWEDTVEFTFPIKGGRVIKVYDADTITIASKLPFDASPMYRLSVRLNGIDTPEIKGKDVSDEEKEAAIIARDVVSEMILHKYVVLKNIQTEKYGRVLADVYIDNINLFADNRKLWIVDNLKRIHLLYLI